MASMPRTSLRTPKARLQAAAAVAAVVALPFAIAGCATGPAFVTPEPPRSGRAAIYVYRTSALPGAAIRHELLLDRTPVGRLVNGSHLRIETPAIEQFVDLQAKGCVRLKQPLLLRAGQIAYVQLSLVQKTVEFGGKYYFDYGCEMHQRNEADALHAIGGLRRAE